MSRTLSFDGTTIAFDRRGDGPVVIISPGALCGRHAFAELAERLAPSFTAVTYDRRGRGDSTDTGPYAVACEVEDLFAVIEANGGVAHVVGHSSGAIIGLEAAAAGVPMQSLTAYEPPYVGRHDPELLPGIEAAIAEGRRGDAVRAFIRTTGMPDEVLPMLEQSPMWPGMEAVAHTLPYDLTLLGDATVPVARMGAITVPTLVADGETSADEMHRGAAQLAAAIPGAIAVTVPGQDHQISQDVFADLVTGFVDRTMRMAGSER